MKRAWVRHIRKALAPKIRITSVTIVLYRFGPTLSRRTQFRPAGQSEQELERIEVAIETAPARRAPQDGSAAPGHHAIDIAGRGKDTWLTSKKH